MICGHTEYFTKFRFAFRSQRLSFGDKKAFDVLRGEHVTFQTKLWVEWITARKQKVRFPLKVNWLTTHRWIHLWIWCSQGFDQVSKQINSLCVNNSHLVETENDSTWAKWKDSKGDETCCYYSGLWFDWFWEVHVESRNQSWFFYTSTDVRCFSSFQWRRGSCCRLTGRRSGVRSPFWVCMFALRVVPSGSKDSC